MTRTAESPGGFVRRARISSADARLANAKTAFMISRSRRVSEVELLLGIGIMCDICSIPRHMSHVKSFDRGLGGRRHIARPRLRRTADRWRANFGRSFFALDKRDTFRGRGPGKE